ncbi:Outer membrane protein, OmpA/MotB-family [Cupriavidus necator]|uniref:Outer membrane protein, OmpA/MotB-family n=1 Tax=Cupriavidus necator TaxID=106590 RepID=A0A1K0JHH5_CUPNE|nr:Outer membrane protein, OmpA/MotB-family [Cupriavidus necator]
MTAWLDKDDPAPQRTRPPKPGSSAKQAVTGQEAQDPATKLLPSAKTIEVRIAEIKGASNPMLKAARPLLRALADIPPKLDKRGAVERLRALLEQELRTFQAVCDRLNIDRKHTTAAHYALCTALDEAVSHTEWGGGSAASLGAWPGSALASTFHQDREGGTKVFLILGRLVESVAENIGPIEVYYHILSLGFQGRYRGVADGDQQLQTIRGRLLDAISKHNGPVPKELSPHWQPAPPGRFHHLRGIPVWMTLATGLLAIAGLAGYYKYQLMLQERDVVQQIEAIGNLAPPPAPKALRLAELLKDEIARGVVAVRDDNHRSTVVFRGDDMFDAGRAEVNAKLTPTLNKVAGEINKLQGKVQVIGHSDNQPIKGARYPSNQVLSEERAAMVSEYLASQGVAKGRLEAIGKGDTEPLTDNKTPAARAANRRVEVVVTQ